MLNVLIAETEETDILRGGGYEVIGVVASEAEARELAAADMRERERKLNSEDDNAPMCPYVYKMFVRGVNGYSCTLEIPASEVIGA